MSVVLAENVDRLCTVSLRHPGPLQDIAIRLHRLAVDKQGGPLCMLAARELVQNVGSGDYVLIATGAAVPPWRPVGETDGPMGAAALARILHKGLGARPVLMSEEWRLEPIIASCEALGISILETREMVETGWWASGLSFAYPQGPELGAETARQLLDEFCPKAVIAIERYGPNEKGAIHGISGGYRALEREAAIHHLIHEARQRGVLTVGVGDGGNELGCGLIYKESRDVHPYGQKCQCRCEGSALTVVPTDVLVIAAISNWGCYGIAACIAYLLQNPHLLHSPEDELRQLTACVAAGAEGGPGRRQLFVDHTDADCQMAVVAMLRRMVLNALIERAPRPF